MHPIFASLEADAPKGISEFLATLYKHVVTFAKQAVDEPEERRAIEEAVLTYFDKYLATRIPSVMLKPFRDSLLKMLDATLVALANA